MKRVRRFKISTLWALGVVSFLPTIVFAQQYKVVDDALGLLNRIIPLIFGVALIWFLWALAQFFLKSDNPAEHEKVVKQILYGVAVMTAMVCIWALVWVVRQTFGLTQTHQSPTDYPQFQSRPIN